MKRNQIIAIAVVGVVIVGFFWWKKRQAARLTAQPAPANTLPTVATSTTTKTQPTQTIPSIALPAITIAPGKVIGGYAVYPVGTSTNVRKEPSTTAAIVANVKGSNLIGTTTGETKTQADGTWMKVYNKNSGLTGWVRADVVRIATSGTAGLNGIRRAKR